MLNTKSLLKFNEHKCNVACALATDMAAWICQLESVGQVIEVLGLDPDDYNLDEVESQVELQQLWIARQVNGMALAIARETMDVSVLRLIDGIGDSNV
jgi:hypothetical protein